MIDRDDDLVVFVDDDEGPSRRDYDAEVAKARADKLAAQRELAETQRYRLELERSRATANFQTLDAQQRSAKFDLDSALETGDERKTADAYARMAQLEGQKEQARQYLNRVNAAPEPQIADPVERVASGLTQKSADWIRRNPTFATDPKKNAAIVGAHHIAVAEDLPVESDAYFSRIERLVGLKNDGNGRSSNGRNMQNNSNTVVLSKGERERANDGSIVWNRGNTDARGVVLKEGDPRIGKAIGSSEYARRKQQQVASGMHNKLG
jgi:hypothetical protein